MTVRRWRACAAVVGVVFVVGSTYIPPLLHGWVQFVSGVIFCLGTCGLAAFCIVRADQIINRQLRGTVYHKALYAHIDQHMTDLAREMTDRYERSHR